MNFKNFRGELDTLKEELGEENLSVLDKLSESLDSAVEYTITADTNMPNEIYAVFKVNGTQYGMNVSRSKWKGNYLVGFYQLETSKKQHWKFKSSADVLPCLSTVVKFVEECIDMTGSEIKGFVLWYPPSIQATRLSGLLKRIVSKSRIKTFREVPFIKKTDKARNYLFLARHNVDITTLFKSSVFTKHFEFDVTSDKMGLDEEGMELAAEPLKKEVIKPTLTPDPMFIKNSIPVVQEISDDVVLGIEKAISSYLNGEEEPTEEPTSINGDITQTVTDDSAPVQNITKKYTLVPKGKRVFVEQGDVTELSLDVALAIAAPQTVKKITEQNITSEFDEDAFVDELQSEISKSVNAGTINAGVLGALQLVGQSAKGFVDEDGNVTKLKTKRAKIITALRTFILNDWDSVQPYIDKANVDSQVQFNTNIDYDIKRDLSISNFNVFNKKGNVFEMSSDVILGLIAPSLHEEIYKNGYKHPKFQEYLKILDDGLNATLSSIDPKLIKILVSQGILEDLGDGSFEIKDDVELISSSLYKLNKTDPSVFEVYAHELNSIKSHTDVVPDEVIINYQMAPDTESDVFKKIGHTAIISLDVMLSMISPEFHDIMVSTGEYEEKYHSGYIDILNEELKANIKHLDSGMIEMLVENGIIAKDGDVYKFSFNNESLLMAMVMTPEVSKSKVDEYASVIQASKEAKKKMPSGTMIPKPKPKIPKEISKYEVNTDLSVFQGPHVSFKVNTQGIANVSLPMALALASPKGFQAIKTHGFDPSMVNLDNLAYAINLGVSQGNVDPGLVQGLKNSGVMNSSGMDNKNDVILKALFEVQYISDEDFDDAQKTMKTSLGLKSKKSVSTPKKSGKMIVEKGKVKLPFKMESTVEGFEIANNEEHDMTGLGFNEDPEKASLKIISIEKLPEVSKWLKRVESGKSPGFKEVKSYTGSYAGYINGVIRHSVITKKFVFNDLEPKAQRLFKHFVDEAPKLEEPLWVYRNANFVQQMEVGDDYNDPAVQSTTISSKMSLGSGGNARLKIFLPKGTSFAPMFGNRSNHPTEDEIVLPPFSKMKVLEKMVDENTGKNYYVLIYMGSAVKTVVENAKEEFIFESREKTQTKHVVRNGRRMVVGIDEDGNEYDLNEKYNGGITKEVSKMISEMEKSGKLKYRF